MTAETSTRAETKGYNRGLILGFTMAESLLLVVFCLLLVAAAVIARERQRAEDAIHDATRLQRELSEETKKADDLDIQVVVLTQRLAPGAQRARTDDSEWRELVLAKRAWSDVKEKLGTKTPGELSATIDRLLVEERAFAKAEKAADERDKQLAEAVAGRDALQKRLDDAGDKLASRQSSPKQHDWPPIISLSEANGNYFRSGSAELTIAFTDKLNGSISDQIAAILKEYGANIVEVIGHTDEQPVSRTTSNMDKAAIDVMSARKPATTLEPADNAGLGLARAISVADVLKGNKALAGVSVLPLSAAQLILPGDTLTAGQAGNVEARRRIEIRIRRRDVSIR
jgi:outer membrane protein OmpA-like peptidoglycan-associated protein